MKARPNTVSLKESILILLLLILIGLNIIFMLGILVMVCPSLNVEQFINPENE